MKNEIKDSAIFHPDGPSNEKQEMLKYARIKKILSLITSRLNLRAFLLFLLRFVRYSCFEGARISKTLLPVLSCSSK